MEKKIYFSAVIALALILSMMSFSSADFQTFVPLHSYLCTDTTVGACNAGNDNDFSTYVDNVFAQSRPAIFYNYTLDDEIQNNFTVVLRGVGGAFFCGQNSRISCLNYTDNSYIRVDTFSAPSGLENRTINIPNDCRSNGQASLLFDFHDGTCSLGIIEVLWNANLGVFNLTSELTSPIDNSSVTVPVTFNAGLFVEGSNITNATLLVWNSTDLVISDFKSENIVNTSATESWTETLPLNQPFIWNVEVCAVNGQCAIDEENETFYTIPTPVANAQYHLIRGQGSIFNVMDSVGAGFAIFISLMGVALPLLLIGLGFVGVLTAIGFGIAHIIKVSMNK